MGVRYGGGHEFISVHVQLEVPVTASEDKDLVAAVTQDSMG